MLDSAETKSSVTHRLPARSTNERRVRARPAVAGRIGATNGTGGAVLREIMRLGRNFWARKTVPQQEDEKIRVVLYSYMRMSKTSAAYRNKV